MNFMFYLTDTHHVAHVQWSPLSGAPQGSAGPFHRHVSAAPDMGGLEKDTGPAPSFMKDKQLIQLPYLCGVSWHGGWNAGPIPARVESCLWGMDSLPQCLLQNHLGAAKQGSCSTQQNISLYWKHPIQWHFRLIKFRVSNFLSVPPRAVLPARPLCLQWDFTGRVCDLLAWIAVNPEHIISQKWKQSSLSWKIIL